MENDNQGDVEEKILVAKSRGGALKFLFRTDKKKSNFLPKKKFLSIWDWKKLKRIELKETINSK